MSSLLHNHPSGDPKPSPDDIEMTREIRKAAEALGIAIHDHLVIGRKGHASFRSLGLLRARVATCPLGKSIGNAPQDFALPHANRVLWLTLPSKW